MTPGNRRTRLLAGLAQGECATGIADLEGLLDAAEKNKVLLQVLRAANYPGALRDKQEELFAELMGTLAQIQEHLRNRKAAFFKLLRPAAYVPADIDVLVDTADAPALAGDLVSLGFFPIVREPYTMTLRRGRTIVDVYTQPSMGGVMYIDGRSLLAHVGDANFHGLGIRTLLPHAEAVMDAAHAVYKEGLYTLSDYLVVKKWADEGSTFLAEQLGCGGALRYARTINAMIDSGIVELPFAIPPLIWISQYAHRFAVDKEVRGTALNLLNSMRDRRIGSKVRGIFARRRGATKIQSVS